MHRFIFEPGVWLGQGTITFSSSPNSIPFYVKWVFDPLKDGIIRGQQQIERQGEEDLLINAFEFQCFKEHEFAVALESEASGRVSGHGGFDNKIIAWKFEKEGIATEESVMGCELYELQDNGDYMFHAEYSSEEYQTIVNGKLWRKQK